MNERHYGVVSPDILKSYDGLAFLKAIADGTVPNPPISETLGFHLIEADAGRAVFAGTPELRHYNPIGSVHGGLPQRCSIPRSPAPSSQRCAKATSGPRSN